MAATVITVSPRVHVDELERWARARVQTGRHGVVFAGSDSRQVSQLHRLYRRLRDDAGLDVAHGRGESDGTWYLCVSLVEKRRDGRMVGGWWGSPKVR